MGLIAAIIFASLAVCASLIFFGLQMSKGSTAQSSDISSEMLAQQIDEGIQRFIKKQQDDQIKAQQEAERAQGEQASNVKKVSKETDHIRGNLNAKISLIEYSDFECPFCKRFHPTAQQVVDEYGGQVNWVYRHFPLGFHDPLATQQAQASECAAELGGNDTFWEYTDKIYATTNSNGRGMAQEDLTTIAVELGLNQGAFQECLDSGKYSEHVRQDIQEGSLAGVTGTPGNILLNNETGEAVTVAGAQPFSSVKAAIDRML